MVEASPQWGLIGVLALLILTALGVPIAASMGVVGFSLMILFYGDFTSIQFAAPTAWGSVANYDLSVFPLFLFMGHLISKSGMGADAFVGLNKLMGRVRGGLAMVSTTTCALFGCVTGSSMSTIVAIGGVAIPEMKQYGYGKELRVGSVAVNGCIANLIPPSMAAIMYCIISETSIARVFVAGVIPGLILTAMILGVIYVWALLKPEAAPRSTETFPLKEKIAALKTPLPILAIFAVMIVGIYRGIFSPSEAAGMGVVFSVVMMVLLGKFTWRLTYGALRDAVKTFTFVFVVLMGAILFANTMALSQLPQFIADHALAVVDSPIAILYMVVLIFLIAGCVMDTWGMLILLVPLLYPVVVQAGFDPVYFGVIVVMVIEMGLLTPPLASNIYVTQAVDGEVTAVDVIRGTLPFYVTVLGLTVLLMHFPMIAMWLPGTMY